jgi:hypothetical protein
VVSLKSNLGRHACAQRVQSMEQVSDGRNYCHWANRMWCMLLGLLCSERGAKTIAVCLPSSMALKFG